MVEGMTERWDHTSATRNQDSSNASQGRNVSLFSCFIVGRPFFLPFRFDRIFATNPSIPKHKMSG
jgi:hypothetical protein